MFTAAVMVCMLGQPMTYLSCDVVSNNTKYMTEDRCWYEINRWIAKNEENLKKLQFQFVSAKCTSWFDNLDPKNDI